MFDWSYGSSLDSYAGARFYEHDAIVNHFAEQMRRGDSRITTDGLSLMFSYSQSDFEKMVDEAYNKIQKMH